MGMFNFWGKQNKIDDLDRKLLELEINTLCNHFPNHEELQKVLAGLQIVSKMETLENYGVESVKIGRYEGELLTKNLRLRKEL